MKSPEMAMSGRRADALDQRNITGRLMAPVHGLEHPVRAGLDRQMKVGHEFRVVAMGSNQISSISRGWLVV